MPTKGKPWERRCDVHYKEYVEMTKAYKDASDAVDALDVQGLLEDTRILESDDYDALKKTARRIQGYVEAIRVEKKGREIHHERFFLKMDDGHKMRIKHLERKMITAIQAFEALDIRAFGIREAREMSNWVRPYPVEDEAFQDSENAGDTMQMLGLMKSLLDLDATYAPPVPVHLAHYGNLIQKALARECDETWNVFLFLGETREAYLARQNPSGAPLDADVTRYLNVNYDTLMQFFRRILMHDPVLAESARDKVSFLDFITAPDTVSIETAQHLANGLRKRLGFGLLWWKDSVVEAAAMWPACGGSRPYAAANIQGHDLNNRFKIVGGWVYNTTHSKISKEAWWYVLDGTKPPPNAENRFVRLCNTFDDLETVLSLGALGMIPPPLFCTQLGLARERGVLSLLGVIVGDIVDSIIAPVGPIPTSKPGSTRGSIQWFEMEIRGYIFGAVRNGPNAFTDAFFAELRARPDLFIVITRSDTDPGRETRQFGGRALPQHRLRMFEAPPRPRKYGLGEWKIVRSAVGVLYGHSAPELVPGAPANRDIDGYITLLEEDAPGKGKWLFSFKKFPVTFFAIIDPHPNRPANALVRAVTWAALCAAGRAKGGRTPGKYEDACTKLMAAKKEELLGWVPEGVNKWTAQKGKESAWEW
ncbi:hypothetical protein FA95DRAFT_1607254 [Auriscalpium vulgare]|uniref:Uncharacterized protein n=1 Tax=Auriscalpium vulgare TaxID=40419 RepID=A0ACB8RPK6_9AGAM|nr:hypothetical protein FA95DRAFT_1607254 [Auriscalpium vulgare]